MLMVYEATERMEPIRFVNDQSEIEAFREKYNDVFVSLRDRWLIEGGIDNYCELWLSQKGIQALRGFKENEFRKEELRTKKKQHKWVVMGVIVSFLGLLLTLLIYLCSL